MDAPLKAALSAALGREVVSAREITGGDINRAYELVLRDGRRFFAKANDRAERGMLAAEARGLGWLRGSNNEGMIIETVNAQTLGAFAREEAAAGRNLPEDIFRVSATPYVSITKA